ncbi:MAG: hypothetical protein K2Q12_10835 [Rickettsiales bacterium]|nr:hypothetical protein [Rickettsiales bacterium]
MRPERLTKLRYVLLSVAIIGLLPMSVFAALPTVDASVKTDFARIVFSWPERVPFTAKLEGRTLKVSFEKQANPDLAAIKSKLGKYVESASMAADGRTALITLRHPYPVRTFISSNSSGIDLLQINAPKFQGASPPATALATPDATPPTPAAKAPVKAELTKTAALKATQPVKKVVPPVADTKVETPAKPESPFKQQEAVTSPKPAAKPVPKPPVAVAKVDKPEPELKKEAAAPTKAPADIEPKAVATTNAATDDKTLVPTESAQVAVAENTAPAKTEVAAIAPQPKPSALSALEQPKALSEAPAAPADSSAPTLTAPTLAVSAAATQISAPALIQAEATPDASAGKEMMVAVQRKAISADFNFPWTERVAAAAFNYGSDFWIVFNKPSRVNLSALQSVAPSFVTHIDQVPHPTSTILRFSLNEDVSPSIRKATNSYEWGFTLSRRSRAPEFPLVAETHSEPPLKPFVFMPVLEAAQPVAMTHPLTGEDWVILPIYKGGQATFPERHFVDAHLPRTAQGVLIIKNSSDVRVAKLRNGVRISSPEGIKFAANLPPLDVKSYLTDEESEDSFFPYERWKTQDATDFAAREQVLRQAISEASDPKASRLRKKLAELYLGDGLFTEALGLLNLIRETDPDYYADYQLAALRGATNFMNQRFAEAMSDFAEPSLEGSQEVDFWKRFSAVMNGNENKLIKFTEFNDLYAKNYPPEMRRRLVLIAADQAIGQEAYQEALNILKTLPKEVMDPIAPYRDFMIGRIYAETGKYKESVETLTKLLDSTEDRFLRARAIFTLATTQFKAGDIDKQELLKQLDALRIVWRGDQLELSLLDLLGNLYVSEKRYIEGLRAWKELATNYPGTLLAQETTAKMSQTFLQLFKDGFANDLPPLTALALYYEFKDLTPLGSDGDQMIQDLADRLASVDLLDRAASLLEHQVMYRLEQEERSRVGARLALIYQLDKKPQQALEVLELTGYGNNPESLQRQRNHLAANAYSALGDWKTALSLLENDFSRESKMLQMDIFWDNKDWPRIITLGEDLLASRSNITAPMTDDEARTLIRLAIAYNMQGDRLQLQYLRDYFSPLMANSPLKPSFDFITDDKGPIDPRNIQQLAEDISKTKTFLDSYRASVEEKGLSSTVK